MIRTMPPITPAIKGGVGVNDLFLSVYDLKGEGERAYLLAGRSAVMMA
jgi:hypothetical protein